MTVLERDLMESIIHYLPQISESLDTISKSMKSNARAETPVAFSVTDYAVMDILKSKCGSITLNETELKSLLMFIRCHLSSNDAIRKMIENVVMNSYTEFVSNMAKED